MIIWIDGTYAVGKTTIGLKINEKLADCKMEFLDSDYYFQEMIDINNWLAFKGLPQENIYFIEYFKKVIEEKLNNNKTLIVAMS